MPLSSNQIDQFHNDGYTTADSFFSDREVEAMRCELDRLRSDGKLRNVRTQGDGQTHSTDRMNLQICPIWPQSDFFRALPFDRKIVDAVGSLIGDPHVFYLDQIFLKPGQTGSGTNWHQDNAYFQISDPSKGTGMWIAIHDATVDNGTMSIIPGSFRESYDHERDPDSDHHIRCWPPENRAVAIELKAGGVLFFNYGTAHRTGDNTTETDRAGLALHFLHTGSLTSDVLTREPGRKGYAHLTGPSTTGGLEEYGVLVDGTWEHEIDHALTGH
jgi:phytanoyl-CoA hydroxylase